MNQANLIGARILWDYHSQTEPLDKAELIVGLGSYDLRVADRCVELFNHSLAQQLCFTGAAGNWTSGLFETSEAAAFAARAMELGAPTGSIHVEEQARNIGENIAFTHKMFPAVQQIIWVTKLQTQRRVRGTLDAQLRDVRSIVTAPIHDFSNQPTDSHSMHDLICELVGDTWRVAAYPEFGFMVEQAIPQQVHNAFNVLVAAGFRDHLPDNVSLLSHR